MSTEPGIVPQSRAAGWDGNDRVALAALVVISAGLCLYRLSARSIWLDEATAIDSARSLHPGNLFPDGGNMAAYNLMLKGWLAVGDSEWIVRAPSVFLAASSAGVLYVLARKFFDRQVALIAAVLLVTNASFVRYGQEARGYVLELLMVSASWLVLAVALERRATKWFVLYGLLVGLAVGAHMFAVFFLAAQIFSLLFLDPRQVPWKKALVGLVVAVMGALPILFAATKTGADQISWIPPLSVVTIRRVFLYLAGTYFPFRSDRALEALSFLLLTCCAAGWAGGLVLTARTLLRRGRSWEAWSHMAVFSWFTVPLGLVFAVSATLQPLMVPRYFMALLPSSVLLLGLAISHVREKVTKLSALVLLVALSLVGLIWTYDSGETGWREAVAYVMDGTEPGDSVLFVPWYQHRPFDYYAERMDHGLRPEVRSGVGSGRVWLVSFDIVEIGQPEQLRSSADISGLLRELVPYQVVSTKGFDRVGVWLLEVQGGSS